MSSYDVGALFGYLEAMKLLSKVYKAKKSNGMPVHSVVVAIADESYSDRLLMFEALNKQDFIDGFADAIEAAYKGELLAVV